MPEPITRHTRFEDLPDLLSVEEVRAYLGLGRSTMYELIRRKELDHIRFGRVIRVPRTSIERIIAGARLGEPPGRGGGSARGPTVSDRSSYVNPTIHTQ